MFDSSIIECGNTLTSGKVKRKSRAESRSVLFCSFPFLFLDDLLLLFVEVSMDVTLD